MREALGHEDSQMGVTIQDGQSHVVGSEWDEFQNPATQGMLSNFSKSLPDMNLAFNVNDEPRVFGSHEGVTSLHSSAVVSTKSVQPVSDNFTRANDIGNGQMFDPMPGTSLQST